MQDETTPLPLRHDTLFGVCEALGRTIGVHPNVLRMTFSVLLLWNPIVIIAAYTGLGVVLAVVHWLVPDVRVESQPTIVANQAAIDVANCDTEAARAA